MPRIKGRVDCQRHFRCDVAGIEASMRLYCMFPLYLCHLKKKKKDKEWMLKSCRNVQRIFLLILYFTAFNAQVFLYLLCSNLAAPLSTEQDLDPHWQYFSSADYIQPYMKTLFSLNMLFTGCLLTACIPMLYPCSALFMLLSHFCCSRLTRLQFLSCRLSMQWKRSCSRCLYILNSVGTCGIFSYSAGFFFFFCLL